MFSEMTHRAHLCLEHARQIAAGMHHAEVLPEHIFLGLLKLDGGLAIDVLQAAGADADMLAGLVEQHLQSLPTAQAGQKNRPELSRQARSTLQASLEAAMDMGHSYVGAEHILIGLASEPGAFLGKLLPQNGVHPRWVAQMIQSCEAPNGAGTSVDLQRGKDSCVCAGCGKEFDWVPPASQAGEEDVEDAPSLCPACAGSGREVKSSHPEVESFAAVELPNATDRVKKALGIARDEARRLNLPETGTEHILFGLLKEEGGVACSVLKKMGIDIQEVRKSVESLARQSESSGGTLPPCSDQSREALGHAAQVSCEMNNSHVGTEHVLLGLLHDTSFVSAQVLHSFGLNYENVQHEILVMLGMRSPWKVGPGVQAAGLGGTGIEPGGSGRASIHEQGEDDSVTEFRDVQEPSGVYVKSNYSQRAADILSRIMDLEQAKSAAIEEEAFERASELRDEIMGLTQQVEDALKGAHRITYTFNDQTISNVLAILEEYHRMRIEGQPEEEIFAWLKSRFFRLPAYAIARGLRHKAFPKEEPGDRDDSE